jgi:N4-gp56 family major capsid protein
MVDTLTTAVTATATGFARLSVAILDVYSKEVLFYAQPELRYEQFAQKRTELNVQPGYKITLLKYNNLTGSGGPLTEGTHLTKDALGASQVFLTVYEFGKAVSVSEFLLQTSFDDVMASASRLLGFHYAKVRDGYIRDQVIACAGVQYGNSRADPASIVAGDTFSMAIVKDAVETLAIAKARKVGDAYVCILHPHQSRKIRDDSDWINAVQYGDPSRIYRGEIGRIEDVRFIETTMQPIVKYGYTTTPHIYADSEDTLVDGVTAYNTISTDIYRALIFGDNAFGVADALPVELRDNGVIDFYRERNLAWYAIWGAGIITTENMLRIETA